MSSIKSAMTRRNFIAALGASAATLGLAACGSSGNSSSSGSSAATSTNTSGYKLVKNGTLIAVSDMMYPPLESMDEKTNKPEGFEVDLMDAVAGKLGLTMEWLPPTKFDAIIPMIKQGGKADVGVSAFTITDERWKEIDFSDSYLDSNQGLVTLKTASDKTEAALNAAGKQIAVQSGTTGEAWVKENLPAATCVTLDDPIQALTGVQASRYDACVADLPVMSYLCNQSYTDLEVALQIPTGEQYGIVVSKDNAQLTKDINKALADLASDGTIDSLEEKWFGTTL